MPWTGFRSVTTITLITLRKTTYRGCAVTLLQTLQHRGSKIGVGPRSAAVALVLSYSARAAGSPRTEYASFIARNWAPPSDAFASGCVSLANLRNAALISEA